LHFLANADPNAIVSELRELPEVEHAVVKPKAIPPSALPTGPLIGKDDQISADSGTGPECGSGSAFPFMAFSVCPHYEPS
jgi:hypothetical protein